MAYEVIRITLASADEYKVAKQQPGIRLFGMWCPILGGGPPITILHIFDYPYEEEDVYIKNVIGDFGSVKRVKKQTYLTCPDVFTGTRLVSVALDATPPRFITINGYLCRIWYKGQPLICNLCGVQGHKSAGCPNKDKCRRCGEVGHFARSCPNPWGAATPPPNDDVDEAEYPALPSQGQDPASQDSVAAAEAAPLAAALMEVSPPAFTEGQDESGAPSSEREEGEHVVDGDGFLVERAAGPHIVKEIIIYDVYDNDENVGAGNLVEPTSTGEIDHPETNVDVSHDSDNCPVVAQNQNVNSVEIANNVVEAAVGGANEIVETVAQNKENVESNNSNINLESSVDPAKNGAPLIEEITNVIDEIVDDDSNLNRNVAEEGMETEVSSVLPPPANPIKDIQSGYEGRTLSKKLKNVATAVRVFRHAAQPSLPSQLRGPH